MFYAKFYTVSLFIFCKHKIINKTSRALSTATSATDSDVPNVYSILGSRPFQFYNRKIVKGTIQRKLEITFEISKHHHKFEIVPNSKFANDI